MNTSSLVKSALVLGAALSLLGAGCAQEEKTEKTAPVPTPSTQETATTTASTYTLNDVAQHKDASSCWTVVRGTVYDLTPAIKQHPGGEQAILFMCGKDATSGFTKQHGGQPRPENELTSLKIGTLK